MRLFLPSCLVLLTACSGSHDDTGGNFSTSHGPVTAEPSLHVPVKLAVEPKIKAQAPVARPKAVPPAAPTPVPVPVPATSFYRALGTEPFWAISIAAGSLSLSRPDEPTRNFHIMMTEKNGVRRYSGDGIAMTVSPAHCSDGMNDAPYPDRVQIATGDTILKGCGGEAAKQGSTK